jgi:hypothetical protein
MWCRCAPHSRGEHWQQSLRQGTHGISGEFKP